MVSDQAHFLSNPREGIDSLVDLGGGVRRRNLRPDTGLVHWHNRVAEADDVDALIHESLRHRSGFLGITDHNRGDGTVIMAGNVKASCLDTFAEVSRVGLELVK